MKAVNTVTAWKEAGVVTKRGNQTICYEIVGGSNITDWQFKRMEITERIFNGPDCYTWRQSFAWLPVKTISGKYVWLRRIYKQHSWVIWGTGFHMEPETEYAELFDILKLGHKL